MKSNEIFALRAALLLARSEALKLKDTEDGGTCNFDTPTLKLSDKWTREEIEEAFKDTTLTPYFIEGNYIHILGATCGQGYRNTEMAKAFRDSLQESGYTSYVHYQMD